MRFCFQRACSGRARRLSTDADDSTHDRFVSAHATADAVARSGGEASGDKTKPAADGASTLLFVGDAVPRALIAPAAGADARAFRFGVVDSNVRWRVAFVAAR